MKIKLGELKKIIKETLEETGAYYGKTAAAKGTALPQNGSEVDEMYESEALIADDEGLEEVQFEPDELSMHEPHEFGYEEDIDPDEIMSDKEKYDAVWARDLAKARTPEEHAALVRSKKWADDYQKAADAKRQQSNSKLGEVLEADEEDDELQADIDYELDHPHGTAGRSYSAERDIKRGDAEYDRRKDAKLFGEAYEVLEPDEEY